MLAKKQSNEGPRGVERAAQLLIAVGQEGASEVLKRLSSDEVQKIGIEMTRMNGLSTEMVNEVLSRFLEECTSNKSLNVIADEYTKNVLIQALGADAAETILERIMMGGNTKGLDSLRWMEPQMIAGIIQNEHPQIQAIVISYLNPDRAGEVLAALPEPLVVELLVRMAEMDSVDPKALQELNYSLEKQVEGVVNKQSSAMGGVKSVASIFNTLDRNSEENLINKIYKVNSNTADRIRELMFVFDDLKKMPNKDFQLLLREVSTDKLVTALKGADSDLIEKVTKNMSARAAEIFLDDMANRGPVKVVDVENTQKEVIGIARQMADSGKIVLTEESAAMIG